MKIFGMVFALHLVLACVLVLIQGCRSTPARVPMGLPVESTRETAPSENWSSQSSSTVAPTPVDSNYAPTESPTLSGLTPAERSRMSPTRPDNPRGFITTESAPAPEAPDAPVSYVVRSGDSLWRIARAHGATVADLQKLNPSIKGDLRPGMIVKVPGTQPVAGSSLPANPMPTAQSAGISYIVKSGDSLSKIAARNGTTVAAMRSANNLRSDVIQVGQSLLVPAREAEPTNTSPAPSPGLPVGGNSPEQVTIVVQRGDVLGEIAKKFAVTVQDLMAANNITNPRSIRPGQKLVVPGFKPVGTGAIPRATTPPPAPSRTTSAPPPVQRTPTDLPPPVSARPEEFDSLPVDSGGAPPPVVPIDEPTPAP